MQLSPYLYFNGQCEAAFRFYEECLGGKIVTMSTYAGTPLEREVPPDWRNKIIHASLMLGDKPLLGCDSPPDRYVKPVGFSVTLGVENLADAERVFNKLAEHGKVSMPLQKTYWTKSFGMLVDRFGIPWMINCEQAA
ncbi:MAG TPA: VOC family protein [Candidatus Acidoferrales bacterium]|nr:VOC family protein [Candidatus Acidoferrales bacterium]